MSARTEDDLREEQRQLMELGGHEAGDRAGKKLNGAHKALDNIDWANSDYVLEPAYMNLEPGEPVQYVVDGLIEEGAHVGLVAPPASLIERIRASVKRPKVAAVDDGGRMVIPDGARNDQLFRIGCALRRYGVDLNAILESLRAVNTDHCSPAIADDELRQIAASAASYAPDSSQEGAR